MEWVAARELHQLDEALHEALPGIEGQRVGVLRQVLRQADVALIERENQCWPSSVLRSSPGQ